MCSGCRRLCTWAGARGLLGKPGTELLAIYHDDPDVTEASKLRVSACLPVDEQQPVDGCPSGFVPDDRPCFESYPMDQKAATEGKHVVRIHVPVRPA